MAIVGGLDIHRRQITYDYLDTGTGETRRGQLSPATRLELRAWLDQFDQQQAGFALEATTGWRFVTEELQRVGIGAHLAEPADTRALRGPKRRAKTDRTDARHLRELLRRHPAPVMAATRPHRRRAHPGPAAPCADRCANRLAPAHPRGAVPPWAARPLRAAHRRRAGVAGQRRAAHGRPRHRRPGLADD